MKNQNNILFEPFRLKSLDLTNRIVMAPMTRGFALNGVPGENIADYYRRRVEAGVGLIITEGTTVNHKAANGYNGVPTFHGEESLAGWKHVLDEVHKAGGQIIPQLWHVGHIRRVGIEPDPLVPGYGPMEIKKEEQVVTVGMKQADIDEVITAFTEAAANAKKLGFDGIEIHGAHEYLIDQFFWEATNRRDDGYGGSFGNRLHLAVELVSAVREAVGPDFMICLRFSQWKQSDYKAKLAPTPSKLEQLLLPLAEAGVDVFHASTRRFWVPEFDDSDLTLAGWTKKVTGKTTITVGSVGLDAEFISTWGGKKANPTRIDGLIERLERNEFDLVAVGRALLADPEWVTKIRDGRETEIHAFSKASLDSLY